jgi:hypothetical protein
VYNGFLRTDAPDLWRNTLAIPRLLGLLRRSGTANVESGPIFEDMNSAWQYSKNDLITLIHVLHAFRLVEIKDGPPAMGAEEQMPETVSLTDFGEYFVTDLMLRLEYLQTVYWEMAIPKNLLFPNFKTVMALRDLEPFLNSLCRFLQYEESKEAEVSPKGAELARDLSDGDSLAELVRKNAGAQINKIYWHHR